MSESSRGRGAKKIVAPRGRGRRTQAERDQILRAERDRNEARDREYQTEQTQQRIAREREERFRRQRELNAARGRGRGRGGFLGDGGGVKHESSGPLSGGSVIGSNIGQGKAFPRPWAPSNQAGVGRAGLNSTGADAGSGSGGGGGGSGGISGGTRATQTHFQVEDALQGYAAVDGGYISSDFEEDDAGPRTDIATITEVIEISDDEAAGDKQPFGAPVRMARMEHKDRGLQVNGEAGEAAVKTEDDAGGDITMTDAQSSARGKSKAQSKSNQPATAAAPPFRGAWRPIPEIKDEPMPDEPTSNARGKQREVPTDTERTQRPRQAKAPKTPIFFNEEERSEHERILSDNARLLEEFGSVDFHKDWKNNPHTYLFQFPPVLPDLSVRKPITIKDDPDGPPTMPTNGTITTNSKETPIKVEAGLDDGLKPDKPLDPTALPSHLPKLEAGSVGKMRVHKSGKVTLDWGGSPFDVSMGMEMRFLQNLVMLRMDGGGEAGMAGTATSFGQPRGRLVVQPDWDVMLGEKMKGVKIEE